LQKKLDFLLSNFKSSCWFLVEYPYVDRIYRDSYYLYYSSKYGRYSRDCVRVSIFSERIHDTDFRSQDHINTLKNNYLGFFILRPTEPAFIGRNIINPPALDLVDFEYCKITVEVTSNGIKLLASGFPHASQDAETLTCAQTTIWTVMEYFGTKYPDYKPVKPSIIHDMLKVFAHERQIPSNGLTVNQISYVLKQLGFGTKIYSREQYSNEFERLINIYIQSGIPLIAAMDDSDVSDSRGIGHAVVIIGKTTNNHSFTKFTTNNARYEAILKKKQLILYDLNNSNCSYVFIDDNHPPYQLATLANPVSHYTTDWKHVTIKYFIAPLYPKIYLEAAEARNFAIEFLLNGPYPLEMMQQITFKCYLASSRTFKHSIALSSIQNNLKHLILEKPMPKFVWIIELSTPEKLKSNQLTGLLILDATEPNISDNKPLIIAAYDNSLVFFDGPNEVLTKFSLSLQSFDVFLNNLTSS